MSKNKTTSTTTQKATPTPEERELNRLDLDLRRQIQPGLIDVQQQGLGLASNLLQGGELPGFLSGLPGGISPEVTSQIVQESLADIRPGLQSAGLFNSGIRAELEARTAADIRRASEEFNIGNKLNLLNFALGGQAQVQAPALSNAAQLGSRLGGLRSISGTSTQTSPNPFLQSFQTGLGGGLGTGLAGGIFGGFSGGTGLFSRFGQGGASALRGGS